MPAPADGITVQILDLGGLRGDADYFFRNANTGTVADPSPTHQWLDLRLYAGLINHPEAGLLLYEAGGPPHPDQDWAGEFAESFPYDIGAEHRLDVALAAAGHSLDEINGVIIGHLHADHAGGIEWFRDSGVPLYVHEAELSHAFVGVATGDDTAFDHSYLDVHLNWVPISGAETELFAGITLVHLPGHTPGLQGALIDLKHSDPLLFVSDQLIFEEHLHERVQGSLNRDDQAWHESRRRVQRLIAAKRARVVFGHDPRNASRLPISPAVIA